MAATDQFYRNQKALDVVFAVSCIVMLISIIWMFVQDYNREFKQVQRQFRDVDEALTERAMLEKLPEISLVHEAASRLSQARRRVEEVKTSNASELRSLFTAKAKQEAEYQSIKADFDSITSLYNIAMEKRDESSEPARQKALQAEVDKRHKEMAGLDVKLTKAQRDLDATLKALKEKQDAQRREEELSKAEDNMKRISGEFDRFAKAAALKRWKWGDTIRKLPVIDGFASPVKINQYTFNEYPIDYSFKYVTRYDRCTSCHLGMELPTFDKTALKSLTPDKVPGGLQDKLAEARKLLLERAQNGEKDTLGFDPNDLPKQVRTVQLSDAQVNEYCVHPRLDLFVDANSPHPAEKFGCTSCHGGQGSATDFFFAAHTPNNSAQRQKWIGEHDWEPSEFWDYPMLAKRFVESSCLKCHHQVTDLIRLGSKEEAPKLIRGYNLVRENGCFGCHEIAGIKNVRGDVPYPRWVGPDLRLEPNPPVEAYTAVEQAKMLADQANPPGTMRKVGPSLYRIVEKTNQQWARKWIQAPRDFRPTTKMPHFYGLSNNSPGALPDDQKNLPDAEIAGIAYYLFVESRDYLGGKDKYRQATERQIKELQQRPQKSEQEMKLLEDMTRRLELDKPPAPLNPKALTDAEGKLVALPAPPADDKGKQEQLKRGRQLFSERGCLACHSHTGTTSAGVDLPPVASEADFAPDLSRLAAKIAPEAAEANPEAKRLWLVQWILDPKMHHPRTRMPQTHLTADQAADVAAWLLSQEVKDWTQGNVPEPQSNVLAELAKVYLLKAPGITRQEAEDILSGEPNQRRGIPDIGVLAPDADERALAGPLDDNKLKWYIGRKAVSRLGCFGCHEVPGFASAKPIGTPLNDWGKKDPERLAFEDILAYANEHYHPVNGNSHGNSHDANADHGKKQPYDSFFLDALHHHQREGFLHQKLVEPRSFDYHRERTWDDRLRMPQFKFARGHVKPKDSETPQQAEWREEAEAREAVMTFILGLLAEPVPFRFLNTPGVDRLAEVKGRQVLDKYNCAGCHQIRPGIYEFTPVPESADKSVPGTTDLLDLACSNARNNKADHFFKDHNAWVGSAPSIPNRFRARGVPEASEPIPGVVNLRLSEAFRYTNAQKQACDIPAGDSLGVRRDSLVSSAAPVGGTFAELLTPYLLAAAKTTTGNLRYLTYNEPKNARAALPPPLFREGEKVQPDWLFKFLRNPSSIRPQRDDKGSGTLVLRMPRFNMSDEEAMALVNYFAAVDKVNNPGEGLSYPYVAVPQQDERYWQKQTEEYVKRLGEQKVQEKLNALKGTWEQMLRERISELEGNLQNAEAAVKTAKQEEKKAAENLRDSLKQELDKVKDQAANKDYDALNKAWLGQQAYAADAFRLLTTYNTPCLSCHQVGNLPPKEPQGPPLQLSAERLRPDWTLRWIANPDRLLSYPTPMPQNFPRDLQQRYPEFQGDLLQQATAVRDVLMYFPKVAEMPANKYYRPAAAEGGK